MLEKRCLGIYGRARNMAIVNMAGLDEEKKEAIRQYFIGVCDSDKIKHRAYFAKIQRQIDGGKAHESDIILFNKLKNVSDPIAELLLAHHGLDLRASSICPYPAAIMTRKELLNIFEQYHKNPNTREVIGNLALSVFFDVYDTHGENHLELSMARYATRLDYIDYVPLSSFSVE